MENNISVCGIDCSVACETCNKSEELLNSPCRGCSAEEGKLFWAKYMGLDTCPIYRCCVHDRHLSHCGQCAELPCSIYFNTKDPSVSDEQHRQGITDRVNFLKNIL